jgi:hypothetical protein
MSDGYKIQLDDGRDLFLVALNQSRTYEGVLEGLPTKEKNSVIIKTAAKTAQELWRGAPYLITPTETAIMLDHDYPFGTPASIPAVVCIARFRSLSAISADNGNDHSELTIVWFQSNFAPPIAESALTHIRLIDWNAYAADYQY